MKLQRKAILLFVILFSIFWVGCSSSNEKAETLNMTDGDFVSHESVEIAEEQEMQSDTVSKSISGKTNDIQTENSQGGSTEFNYGNRKIIKQGSLTIETLEFDKTLEIIKEDIRSYNGYIETINVNGNSYNRKSLKRANVTVRVPKNVFESFLSSVGELGFVANENINTQDVSSQYFDTQARLRSLKTKENRLLDILDKTNDLEYILQLENELSNTIYQIEKLTGSLQQMDSLVNYSTINISLIEVEKVTPIEPKEKESFISRLNYNFKESYINFTETLEELALSLARNSFKILFWIIILIVLLIIGNKKYNLKNKIKPMNFSEIKKSKEGNENEENKRNESDL